MAGREATMAHMTSKEEMASRPADSIEYQGTDPQGAVGRPARGVAGAVPMSSTYDNSGGAGLLAEGQPGGPYSHGSVDTGGRAGGTTGEKSSTLGVLSNDPMENRDDVIPGVGYDSKKATSEPIGSTQPKGGQLMGMGTPDTDDSYAKGYKTPT